MNAHSHTHIHIFMALKMKQILETNFVNSQTFEIDFRKVFVKTYHTNVKV